MLQNAVFDVYSVTYTETAGTPATVTRTPTYTKMAASAYTRSGSTFTLTSPASTAFSAINSGQNLVDIANSNSTATSGSTLYKVTGNSAVREIVKSSYGSYEYFYIEAYKKYTVGTSIALPSESSSYITITTQSLYGYQIAGGVLYSSSDSSWITSSTSATTVYEWRKGSITDYGDYYEGDYVVKYKCTAPIKSRKITYTPYTAPASRGSQLDTIEAPADSLPANGAQDGYWYVLLAA